MDAMVKNTMRSIKRGIIILSQTDWYRVSGGV
jgi:hypothetical protein